MHFSKALAATLLATSFALGGASFAQDSNESHHPDAAASPSTQPSEAPSGGMMGDGMMGKRKMGGGMMGHMMQGGMMHGMCPTMGMSMGDGSLHTAGRIAFLKEELEITDAQKDDLDAYAAALKKSLEDMNPMRSSMMSETKAEIATAQLDARIEAMEKRLASLKEIKPALDKLYAALSDAQKKKADQILTGMGCMK